jgi:hypothetical protein
MKEEGQAPKFKLLSTFALTLLAMVILFSCSKNKTDVPRQQNEGSTDASISSQASTRTSLVAVPFEDLLFVPCANGGAGEDVLLTGATNFVYQLTWNDHGFYLSYHFNHHGVTGVGLSSGETFVASGGNQTTAVGSWVNSEFIATTDAQMRVTGQSTSFTVNYKVHITITPDGNVAVNVREQTADCKM